MRLYPLVGIGAGIATALLIASTATGGLAIRLLVHLLAPLPLVLAGLGLGSLTAAIGGATSTILLLLLSSKVAALHLTSTAIPVVVLCHLALLSRSATPPADEITAPAAGPTLEWYPLGRIVSAAAIMAGVHGILSTLVLGIDLDEQRKMLRSLMQIFAERFPRPDGKTMSEEQISTFVEMGIYTLPAAAAFSWLLGTLVNVYLGARITAASGQLARPMPDVPSMVYPSGLGLALAAALPLAFAGGTLGFVGAAFAGGLFCAHLLLGLAIIHDISRGSNARPALLTGLYVALVLLNSWTAIALTIFAALSPILPLKRGRTPLAGKPD